MALLALAEKELEAKETDDLEYKNLFMEVSYASLLGAIQVLKVSLITLTNEPVSGIVVF